MVEQVEKEKRDDVDLIVVEELCIAWNFVTAILCSRGTCVTVYRVSWALLMLIKISRDFSIYTRHVKYP